LAAKTVDDVLQTSLVIPIWMPHNFVSFAKQFVEGVSKDHPGSGIEDVLEIVWQPDFPTNEERLSLVRFQLSPVMMYQQIDRRLDE
jgi:hypothetical protein